MIYCLRDRRGENSHMYTFPAVEITSKIVYLVLIDGDTAWRRWKVFVISFCRRQKLKRNINIFCFITFTVNFSNNIFSL